MFNTQIKGLHRIAPPQKEETGVFVVGDWEQGVRVPEPCVGSKVFLCCQRKQHPEFLLALRRCGETDGGRGERGGGRETERERERGLRAAKHQE